MSDHNSSAKAILYALVANFGIAVAKLVAAMYTGSGSMLAEAIHSFSDCANQILLFIGLRQSKKPPSREHPMGYGKVTYFWSFVVALLLFTMGGVFSIYEGWHKLHDPEPVSKLWVALMVLGLSILLEGGSLAGCLKEIAPPAWRQIVRVLAQEHAQRRTGRGSGRGCGSAGRHNQGMTWIAPAPLADEDGPLVGDERAMLEAFLSWHEGRCSTSARI